MKHAICAGAALLCNLLHLSVSAQVPVRQSLPNKPLLFNQLSSKTNISAVQLEQLFSLDADQHVKIPLGSGTYLTGVVKEKVARNKHVTNVTIECTNYDGALLTVSRIGGTGSSITYLGRVVNIRYGDVLLLTGQDDRYYLVKEKASLVIVE
ncbi:MAG: hypothetical protein INR73_24710 [Williamsia sp.]|nr:hypothetical protein [Williamsia sp.]